MNKKIGIIGATGNVGRKVVAMLLDKKIVSHDNIKLFASPKSAGQLLNISGNNLMVNNAETSNFSNLDVCVFNTESDVSEKLVPRALAVGAYVVDSSSHYRLNPDVPLIIPPVNKKFINFNNKLYSHANCLASPISTVIYPLHVHNSIKRINAVTYQSTSGAGKLASDDCWNEMCSLVQGIPYKRQHFKRQIALNVIPQVGNIMDDGFTFEEYKIIQEIKKVVDHNIAMTATAVRVPVLIGHSIALNVEFIKPFEISEVMKVLKKSESIQLSHDQYSTPIEVVDSDDVFVGRIRRDPSVANGMHLWLCSDNLRRGAATDSVEIVEAILKTLRTAAT